MIASVDVVLTDDERRIKLSPDAWRELGAGVGDRVIVELGHDVIDATVVEERMIKLSVPPTRFEDTRYIRVRRPRGSK